MVATLYKYNATNSRLQKFQFCCLPSDVLWRIDDIDFYIILLVNNRKGIPVHRTRFFKLEKQKIENLIDTHNHSFDIDLYLYHRKHRFSSFLWVKSFFLLCVRVLLFI